MLRVALAGALVGAFVPAAWAGEWIADKNGCQVWNQNPVPNESVRWSGKCAGGKASGKGALEWFAEGEPNCRDEGTWVEGRMEGPGVYVTEGGSRWEGQYVGGERHGPSV